MRGFRNWNGKSLSLIFPKLNSLEITNYHDDELVALKEYFPNLYDFKLDSGVLVYDNLETFFELNPNIRSLKIGVLDFYKFKSFGERYLQSIESLIVHSMDIRDYNSSLHFSNVKTFKIKYLNDANMPIPTPRIPFSFSELKEFAITNFGNIYPDFFITFLNENPFMEKITLMNEYLLAEALLTGSLAALPFLKDTVMIDSIDTNDLPIILPFLDGMKRFTFLTRDTDDEVKACCGDGWRVYRYHNSSKNFVTLERIDANI